MRRSSSKTRNILNILLKKRRKEKNEGIKQRGNFLGLSITKQQTKVGIADKTFFF